MLVLTRGGSRSPRRTAVELGRDRLRTLPGHFDLLMMSSLLLSVVFIALLSRSRSSGRSEGISGMRWRGGQRDGRNRRMLTRGHRATKLSRRSPSSSNLLLRRGVSRWRRSGYGRRRSTQCTGGFRRRRWEQVASPYARQREARRCRRLQCTKSSTNKGHVSMVGSSVRPTSLAVIA